jgi:hypothetical protein
MDAGLRVQDRHLSVDLNGRVIVDSAGRRQHPTVSVIGELIEADIRHDQALVTDLLTHGSDRGGQDAVLVLRYAEEHDPCQARICSLYRRLAEAVEGVLDHAGHGADWARLSQPFGYERRQDQLARLKTGLPDHRPHRGSGPQASRPVFDHSAP